MDGEAWILRCAQNDGGLGLGPGAGVGGACLGWARGRRAGAGVADGGYGEGAGLPECEELFEAGEDSGEDGGNQGVECCRQAGARLLPQGAGLGGGDRGAEGWSGCHWFG